MRSMCHSLRSVLITTSVLIISSAALGVPNNQLRGQSFNSRSPSSSSLDQLKEAAKNGDADAQYALGYMYYYGQQVQKDLTLARQWIRRAASQGQERARTALSLMGEPAPVLHRQETNRNRGFSDSASQQTVPLNIHAEQSNDSNPSNTEEVSTTAQSTFTTDSSHTAFHQPLQPNSRQRVTVAQNETQTQVNTTPDAEPKTDAQSSVSAQPITSTNQAGIHGDNIQKLDLSKVRDEPAINNPASQNATESTVKPAVESEEKATINQIHDERHLAGHTSANESRFEERMERRKAHRMQMRAERQRLREERERRRQARINHRNENTDKESLKEESSQPQRIVLTDKNTDSRDVQNERQIKRREMRERRMAAHREYMKEHRADRSEEVKERREEAKEPLTNRAEDIKEGALDRREDLKEHTATRREELKEQVAERREETKEREIKRHERFEKRRVMRAEHRAMKHRRHEVLIHSTSEESSAPAIVPSHRKTTLLERPLIAKDKDTDGIKKDFEESTREFSKKHHSKPTDSKTVSDNSHTETVSASATVASNETSSEATTTPAVVASVEPTLTPVVDNKSAEISKEEIAANEHRLLDKPNDHYTLQLMGSFQSAALKEILKDSRLEAKGTIYHTYFKEKDWYVLVYGDYESPEAALSAIDRLPPSTQQLKPWVKPFASVKSSIRAAKPDRA